MPGSSGVLGREMRAVFNGTEIQFRKVKNSGRDDDESCTTMDVFSASELCTNNMNILCGFYHNLKIYKKDYASTQILQYLPCKY